MERSSRTKYTFAYNGATYKSFADFCRYEQIPQATIYKIRSDNNCTLSEAVDIWFERYGKRLKNCRSVKELAGLYGIPYDSARGNLKENSDEFIAKYMERGAVLPDSIQWIDEGWTKQPDTEHSMSVLNISPDCYADSVGNLLFVFSDSNGLNFQVQFQQPKVWLFRVGPCPVSKEFDLSSANSSLWYGAWVELEDGIYLQYAQTGKKVLWTDVLKTISVLSRICKRVVFDKP